MLPVLLIVSVIAGRPLGRLGWLYLSAFVMTMWLAFFAGLGGAMFATRSDFDLASPPTRDGGSNWTGEAATSSTTKTTTNGARTIVLRDGDARLTLRAAQARVGFDALGRARTLTASLAFADDARAAEAIASLRTFLRAPPAGGDAFYAPHGWRATIRPYRAGATDSPPGPPCASVVLER